VLTNKTLNPKKHEREKRQSEPKDARLLSRRLFSLLPWRMAPSQPRGRLRERAPRSTVAPRKLPGPARANHSQ